MAAFAENFDLDSLRQIYDIREVNSLAEFLLPGHSLCIIHDPVWREFQAREYVDAARVGGTGGRVRLITVQGHSRQGLPDKVLLGICGPDDQGYYRQKLDKNLKSSFLFATWKHEAHGFRLIRDRQAITFFPSFDEALTAYFPDGFIPEYSREEKQLPERYDSETPFLGDWSL